MTQITSTRHDTKDNEDENNGGFNTFPFALLVLIASPLTVVSALLTYAIFAVGKVKISVITILGLLPSLLILLMFGNFAVTQFIESFTVTIPAMFEQRISVFQGITEFLLQQALLSVPLGILAGIIYSSYRWYTRPIWVERTFRKTPWEILRKKKNIKDIQSDKNSPLNGMTLGVKEDGNKIIQTFEESRAHTIILGASGAGKTKMIETRLRDALKAGQGAIIVDLKGGKDLAESAAKFAERYDKKFQHWLFQPTSIPYTGPALNGPAYYDPISRGEATRRSDLLIETRRWSEEHYKIQANYFLQLVMSVIVANPKPGISTFTDVIQLLDPKALQQRAIPLGTNPIYSELVRQIDRLNDEKMDRTLVDAMRGLSSQFGVLLNSVAGPYLQRDPKGVNNIDLFRAAQEGEIVVFSLDSSNYPDQAALIANLIIQDLKTVSSELRANQAPKPFQVIIDEFSAIGSENIVGLINKSRDANMPVTLTTQALGDLKQNSATLQDQLLGIVNSFIIQRTNRLEDAIELAGLSGKTIRKRFSENVVYKTGLLTRGRAAGRGNIEDVEEYVILPKQIQALKTGEFFYINKNPMRIEHGLCIIEDPEKIIDNNEPKINFTPDAVFKDTSNPEADADNFTPGQLIAPPISKEELASLTIVKETKPSKPSKTTQPTPPQPTPKPVDMEKIKTLIKNPEILLPNPQKRDVYKTTLMPERVAPELPKLPELKPDSSHKTMPTLPNIPTRVPPKQPSDKTKPNPGSLTQQLPPLPTIIKKTTDANLKNPEKDEFDF